MFALVGREVGSRVWRLPKACLGGRDGQGMVEYALLLMLIGTIVLVVLIVLGNQVSNAFHNVSCSLSAMGGTCSPAPPPASAPLPPS